MHIPINWLGEYVELPQGVTGEQVAADLVRLGFEEESLGAQMITGPLVVGKVLSREPDLEIVGEAANGREAVKLCRRFEPDLVELIQGNEIFVGRTRGVGTMTPEQALEMGLTGPPLRCTGVDFDVRDGELFHGSGELAWAAGICPLLGPWRYGAVALVHARGLEPR